MPIYSIDGIAPIFDDPDSNFVAPDANVIGNVRIGKDVSIWFGCAIRGDNELITIGKGSNVQEHTIMHTDPGFALTIGENCTIGHRAMLHGCTIGDNSLIGMGATVLNGAKIGKNCLVGAGALVTEGKQFPDNSLIIGQPAKVARTLDEGNAARLAMSSAHYVANGKRFRKGLKQV